MFCYRAYLWCTPTQFCEHLKEPCPHYNTLSGHGEVDDDAISAETTATTVFSSGLRIVDMSTIYVDCAVLSVMKQLSNHVGTYEVAALFNLSGNRVTLPFYVPKQTVSAASVDYEEPIAELAQQYPVHIHKHPSGTSKFSHNDLETTCVHFKVTLLYSDSEITDARVSIKGDDGNVYLIEPNIEIVHSEPTITRDDTSKIIIQPVTKTYNYNKNKKRWGWFR